MNGEESIRNWQVDTNSSDKVLTVSGREVDPQRVENLVHQAGFQAYLLQVAGANGGDL